MGSETQYQLPVVDFGNENMKPGTDAWVSACKVVRSALEDHGGFLAHYDKADPELNDSVYSAMKELFDLPIETKKQQTTDKPIFSYAGQRPDIPLFESVGIDNPLSIQGCQKYTNIMWPEGNDRFSESVNSYAKQVVALDQMVKRMVFESFGVEKHKCEAFLESTDYVLRGYKYRPPKEDESNTGVNPHSDSVLVSILNQKVHGLEIKLKDGEWFQVDASPSLFLVMAGDAFLVWSNDRLRAGQHRVFVKSETERYSLALMSYSSKILVPEEDLVDEEHPIRYKPLDHYGYLRFFLTEEAVKSSSRIKTYCGV